MCPPTDGGSTWESRKKREEREEEGDCNLMGKLENRIGEARHNSGLRECTKGSIYHVHYITFSLIKYQFLK